MSAMFPGQVRVRVQYKLRIVGFLSDQVLILEGVEDQRRTTETVAEVATWKVDEHETLLWAAREIGKEEGENAGSWVLGGNTSKEAYQRVLQGLEDWDPEVLDSLPLWPDLSGEWAGTPTAYDVMARIFSQAHMNYDGPSDDGDAAYLDEYEAAYSEAAQAEVERLARLHLS